MKKESEKVALGGKSTDLEPHGYDSIRFSFEVDERANPADVVITTRTPSVSEKSFAERSVYDSAEDVFPIVLKYYSGKVQQVFLFLMGIFKILFISPKTQRIEDVVRLNRDPADDRGFYQSNIYEFESFFIYVYEGGACRISYDGECLWHTPLTWNDQLISVQEDALKYVDEKRNHGNEWKIDIVDGRIILSG